ncbi:putative ankyrin repeat protein [Rosellinia necatrix]|uniref:Putative ankyrin repeat protein n=1 Tax=Rosellinia necatrix TaxID=77044 RepID=A0A1S7UHB9_ROSNE|nr:putative ankyrin repeat protein [Rosellinia necatrix]
MLLHPLFSAWDSPAPGSEDIPVDIVLVHGLGGHYTRTWEAEDETVWPTHLLPKRLGHKNIRVLSFEYGGSIKGTTSKAGINDTANNLLEHLMDQRRGAGLKWWPIIFIGHSLGGVIIKRAIQMAYNNPRFKSIDHATLGVMFFATPHRGSPKEFSTILQNILRCNGPRMPQWLIHVVQPTEGMVRELQRNLELFDFISGDFIHFSNKLQLRSFRETKETSPVGRLVVDRSLGKMELVGEEPVPIAGDHLSLCKFKQDQTGEDCFSEVWQGIEIMIENSPINKDLKAERAGVLDSLCTDMFCQSMMAKSVNRTGDWLFNRMEFEDWLNRKSGKPGLWISGEPGCGKSYLAKHVVDELRERGERTYHAKQIVDGLRHQGELVVCTFLCDSDPSPTNTHSWYLLSEIIQQVLNTDPEVHPRQSSPSGSGVRELLLKTYGEAAMRLERFREPHPAENNVQGLLAATVRQVLEMAPDLNDNIRHNWRNGKPPGSWTLDALKTLWLQVMTEWLKQHTMIIVIDGFDKLKGQCQEDFLNTLGDYRNATQTPDNLRLLFFSNEYPDLQSQSIKYGFTRYTITAEDTRAGLSPIINHHLDLIGRIYKYPPQVRQKIEKDIPKAGNGNYLRTDLMLGSLKRAHYTEATLSELVDSSSNGTLSLYDHLFGRLWAHEENRRLVKQVLLWIVFQRERLDPTELSIARALGKMRESANRRSIPHEKKLHEILDESTELWVGRFCGHLVKLEGGRFDLVHPSLRKYLTTKPDRLDKEGEVKARLRYHTEYHMDVAASHSKLGNICADYLAMSSFESALWPEKKTWAEWQAAVEERMNKHRFFRYAALYWSEHLKLAHDLASPGNSISEGVADRDRREMLENPNLGNAQSWAEVQCYFHSQHEHEYPKMCSFDDKIKHKLSPIVKTASPAGGKPSILTAVESDPLESSSLKVASSLPQPTSPSGDTIIRENKRSKSPDAIKPEAMQPKASWSVYPKPRQAVPYPTPPASPAADAMVQEAEQPSLPKAIKPEVSESGQPSLPTEKEGPISREIVSCPPPPISPLVRPIFQEASRHRASEAITAEASGSVQAIRPTKEEHQTLREVVVVSNPPPPPLIQPSQIEGREHGLIRGARKVVKLLGAQEFKPIEPSKEAKREKKGKSLFRGQEFKLMDRSTETKREKKEKKDKRTARQ